MVVHIKTGTSEEETAAAEVGDDNAGSAIIRRIMAIAQATAAGGASEAGSGVEEDNDRNEGVFVDSHSGPDDDGMVLGGPNLHVNIDHAPSPTGQRDTVRPPCTC